MKRTLLSLLTIFIAGPSFAQQADLAKFRKIDSLLTYLNANNKFMGSVAIQEKGKVVFDKAYGFANAENKLAAKPDTKYKIGSVTKIFTAAMIFQLIEEKKLNLNRPLSEFYPKIPNADKITIGHLLNHKSGIANYTDSPDFENYRTQQQTNKDMLARLESGEPVFDPGVRGEYSNSNYILLGYIIQDITKKSYKENLSQRITGKAGLKNTYYYTKINPKRNEAYSYTFTNGKWDRTEEWHESVAGAAGAIQSTATDLTKFINTLFTGKIVSKSSLDQMMTIDWGFGKGLLAYPFLERKFFGYNGGIESFKSVVSYYPKEEMGFAVLVNGGDYNTNDIILGILSIYYKKPYIFPNLTSVALDESALKVHEGIYSTPSLPFKVDIKLVKGELVAHATNQGSFPLNPVSENEFNYPPAGITITFNAKGFTLRQADGSISQFTKE